MERAKKFVIGGLVAALIVGCGVNSATAAGADTTQEGDELLPIEGATLVADVAGPTDVELPDGRVLRLPAGSSVLVADGVTRASTPAGDTITVPTADPRTRASSSYYPPVTITHSRSQVENVYRAINNVGNVCRFLPLPYLASIGCSASSTIKNAYSQAHYQSKRVRVDFYRSKVCGSCSYSKYTVIR